MPKKPTEPKTLRDLYDLLEVGTHVSHEVLEAARKALLVKHHPDRGGDEEAYKAVARAYDILTDPVRRRRFEAQAETGTMIGNYRVIKKIAEGGFGATYKGEHVILKQPVCLKQGFMNGPEAETILLDEASALWDMRHYALPAMRDVIRHEDGSLVLVMSFVEGPTLEQLVEQVGRLDPEHVAWITQRLLNGLLYLHQHGVVHGDLKPSNVIIQPKQHLAVLVDFGLTAIRPTAKTSAKGYTELFSAPEMMAGRPPLPETDLYSLGRTMLYALGGSYEAVEQLKVPSGIPDPMCAFVKRLIVRDVLARPNWTKEDLIATLHRVRKESFGRKQSNLKPIPGYS